ncbi:MAG: GNAT family N-acetyltransferase [Pseudomonadota bacterium]
MSLREIRRADATRIGQIIGHSFADDPVNLWVFKHYPPIEFYYQQMAKKLYLTRGFGHITEEGTAASLWLPPNTSKHIPAWRSMDIAISMLFHGGVSSLRNGMALDECLHAHIPQVPHFYLSAIGTLPECQGKGVGGDIIRAGLERVDSARMPAYLESSKEQNLPFYQRFGFQVSNVVQATPEAPGLWLMWREPKQ